MTRLAVLPCLASGRRIWKWGLASRFKEGCITLVLFTEFESTIAVYTVKNWFARFPSPAGMSLTKLSQDGNYTVLNCRGKYCRWWLIYVWIILLQFYFYFWVGHFLGFLWIFPVNLCLSYVYMISDCNFTCGSKKFSWIFGRIWFVDCFTSPYVWIFLDYFKIWFMDCISRLLTRHASLTGLDGFV